MARIIVAIVLGLALPWIQGLPATVPKDKLKDNLREETKEEENKCAANAYCKCQLRLLHSFWKLWRFLW